tara:strand:+ start:1290 stop:1709 length:420 start_codon:yes stop_codon:yes gene_type:complete
LNNNISDKDKKAWQNFLQSEEKVYDKDNNNKKLTKPKVNSIDLHGYSLDEANSIIENFINKNYDLGIHKLIIVTGKGLHSNNEKDPYVSKDLGILKYSVPEYIKNNKELMKKINDINGADLNDGGSGAFYIYLKKNKKI